MDVLGIGDDEDDSIPRPNFYKSLYDNDEDDLDVYLTQPSFADSSISKQLPSTHASRADANRAASPSVGLLSSRPPTNPPSRPSTNQPSGQATNPASRPSSRKSAKPREERAESAVATVTKTVADHVPLGFLLPILSL
jgi:hypothetical protein